MKTLDIKESQKISYCIPTALRDENIKINLRKVKGRFEPSTDLKEDKIAIVCFGPSLKEEWEKLKDFKYIMTCSGAHKFLITNEIIPTWHVDLEPREHKIKMLGDPHPDVEYLIASTVHPRYFDQLKGFNVKLWHIFANENDGAAVLPRGEWQVTGGSSVGLRCMTLARLLGFTDLHIFGMDGNIREENTHTTEHPNAPKKEHYHETEYNGKKYFTTPSILFCAKETFKELDQMPDVKATFYGDNLVADMAKDYKPGIRRASEIAYNKPELISKEYIDLNRRLHEDNPSYGMGGAKHAETVIKLVKGLITTENQFVRVLDFGAGKGMLAKSLPFSIEQYDPAVPEISQTPAPADLVVASDVLEHIEPDKLQFVLDELRRLTKQVGYFVISTRKAVKKYANGENAHLIVQGKSWWEKKLSKFFEIGTIIEKEKEAELHIVVGPKIIKQPDITTVEKDGKKFKFLTPNDTTKWRAESLFKKEPSTIEWLDSIPEGAILYDIGANVGSYTIYAGVKGVKVYAFEPEAENYAVLVKNMQLNNIQPNAYCLALSNEDKLGTLFTGSQGAGGACHSFNESKDFNLNDATFPFSQGSIGFALDELVKKGLPQPDYIKIDVDGLEYKVIEGAKKTLQNIKSLIIETNPSIPEHQEMIKLIRSLGFEYDEVRVGKAKRKEGTFKGVAEYVFTKKWIDKSELNAVSVAIGGDNLAYKIQHAAMELEPYNYLYIENFFNDFEYELLKEMPDNYIEIEKSRGTKGYPLRYTSNPIEYKSKSGYYNWKNIYEDLLDGKLKASLLDKFGIKDEGFVEDLLLVRDLPGYKIPPHTDSLRKVITVLIYLPEDDSFVGEGTSIFEPKEKGFICKSGHHHKFEDFNKVRTLPFKPNSAFIFARTDNSFHGVEPCGHIRNVLLYNINRK